MDHEYLQNVMGSPYVNEGAFDQLKAKAAQAMGAMGSMAGHQIQSPTETKLRSLWEGFVSSLKKSMKDWENQISPMFDEQVPLNEKQQQVKDTLDELARSLTPIGPRKIGKFTSGGHNPDVRNQRDNPETYVKGSAYNRSTTSPQSSKLKDISSEIKEGFWDAAKRDIGLNKSLGSNDPSTILDSYKNHILGIFKNFMKDAVKMTKMTAQQIYSMLAKIQPAKPGWQASGNIQKIVNQLQILQNVGDIKGKGLPPRIPGAETSPVISQTPNAVQPTSGPKQQTPSETQPTNISNPPTGGTGVVGGSGVIPPEHLPLIILKAIKIIIDAVKSDAGHAGKYFSVNELPKDFGGQSLTKEIVSAPKPKGGTPSGENQEETPEIPGEFLYNFHSKHRKTPKSSFSIQVVPVHESPNIDGLPYNVEVFWQNESHKNKIWVVVETQGKKSKPMLIMQFFDNEVNSKSGATTPGDTNFFTVDKILQAATPNANPKDPDPKNQGLLAKATNEVKLQIKKLENPLLRALMATTGRKAMEWKPKSNKVFPVTYNSMGDVTYTNDKGEKETIKKNQVSDLLNKSDYETSEKWKETLDHYDYFDTHGDIKPKDISEYPAFVNAQAALMQEGLAEAEANKLLIAAWMKLSKNKPKEQITGKELYDVAFGDKKHKETPEPTPDEKFDSEMTKNPELSDAFTALKQLGYTAKESYNYLQKTWEDLSTSKNPSDITSSELVKVVISGGKKTPNAPKPSAKAVPTHSTANPPTPPVSEPASGPEPTAPVSNKGKEDVATQSQQSKKTPGVESVGKIDIKGDDLEWENPDTHEVYSISPDQVVQFANTKPKFLASLKNNPDVYNKYKDMINQKIASKGKKDEPPTVKEHFTYINPFNFENLLY